MHLSTTAKGRDFEVEVEQWLQGQGYRETRRNEKVKVSEKYKPYECDVHGHCYSVIWDKLRRFGLYYYIFILVATGLEWVELTPFVIGLGIFSFTLAYVGKKKTGHHVWVECKNLNGKVSRDHVVKLVNTVDQLQQYKQAEWRPKKVMLFSSTDFERDALRFAKENSIHCYRKDSRGFCRVTF